MTTVGVYIPAKRGHLVHHIICIENADSAEIDSDRNRTREKISHVIGTRCSCKIPIEMSVSEQSVSHRTSNTPCLEPRLLQTASDPQNLGRRVELVHQLSLNIVRTACIDIPAPSASIKSMRAC